MNKLLDSIRQPDSVALNDRVQKLRQQGTDVIGLNVGDPDFATPIQIIDAAHNALRDGFTHYSNSRGLPPFRKAIAKDILNKTGVKYNPETEILVSNGAVHAYFTGLSAILNPGDEILVPDPTWMTHFNMVKMLGGSAVPVPALPENNFFPTLEELKNKISDKTIAVVVNSPSNPTGAVASREYLEELVDFARQNNIYIISDEVYEKIVFDNKSFTSILEIDGAKEITLLLQSFSKTYAMTGWRLGYLAAPENVINLAVKASQYTLTNHQSFIQMAGLTALENKIVNDNIDVMVKEYQFRRDMATDILNSSEKEIKFNVPAGAFYYFVDISGCGLSSKIAAEEILEKKKVAVVPGSVYGEYGEGFIRLGLASSREDIKHGFTRVVEWYNSI